MKIKYACTMEWYSTIKENEITYVGKMDGT